MCHTGQCKYENDSGSCTWDWGEGVAPPDGGCFPTEEQEQSALQDAAPDADELAQFEAVRRFARAVQAIGPLLNPPRKM